MVRYIFLGKGHVIKAQVVKILLGYYLLSAVIILRMNIKGFKLTETQLIDGKDVPGPFPCGFAKYRDFAAFLGFRAKIGISGAHEQNIGISSALLWISPWAPMGGHKSGISDCPEIPSFA